MFVVFPNFLPTQTVKLQVINLEAYLPLSREPSKRDRVGGNITVQSPSVGKPHPCVMERYNM
ncbi:hypothetical protein N1851_024977 [Merluccius polli]|uniref:Uncharacterized protein n=1 Tax=Merluccius polli TaxID=89951 RepID=A0AA47MEB7_MERPO|nr:hypothetical protein N1851_024977 [Merluccius polli]